MTKHDKLVQNALNNMPSMELACCYADYKFALEVVEEAERVYCGQFGCKGKFKGLEKALHKWRTRLDK